MAEELHIPTTRHFKSWTTCPAHLKLLDLITLTIFGERYKLLRSLLWSLLHSPFPSLLSSNIRLRILFSNTLSLHSSLNVKDHVSQPYSTTGNIIVLYILIFKLLERSLTNQLHGLWNPEVQCHIYKGSPIIPILS